MPITKRPKPVPRPRPERMNSISAEDRARTQQYDKEMAEYRRQTVALRKQQRAEAAAKRRREAEKEAEKADRMFASINRAIGLFGQSAKTTQDLNVGVQQAIDNQAKQKYNEATPYRLLLKSLPYAIPLGSAVGSLAIDGARAFRYAQQAALTSNRVKNWVISQAFRNPNSKLWGNLLNSAVNAATKPRFSSLANVGLKQQLALDGVGLGFDAWNALKAANEGQYGESLTNSAQGILGALGILGTLNRFGNAFNSTMNVVRPASNIYEIGDDASSLKTIVAPALRVSGEDALDIRRYLK